MSCFLASGPAVDPTKRLQESIYLYKSSCARATHARTLGPLGPAVDPTKHLCKPGAKRFPKLSEAFPSSQKHENATRQAKRGGTLRRGTTTRRTRHMTSAWAANVASVALVTSQPPREKQAIPGRPPPKNLRSARFLCCSNAAFSDLIPARSNDQRFCSPEISETSFGKKFTKN